MPFSTIGVRRSLLTAAVLLVAVAVVIAVIVIPRVKGDTYPRAAPEQAAFAFLVHIALDLGLAILLALIALKAPFASQIRRGMRRVGLGALALLVLLCGVALIDAGAAFYSHGAAMVLTSIVLFVCSAAEVAAGLLSGGAALFLPAADVQ